jgi:hypothetical protein
MREITKAVVIPRLYGWLLLEFDNGDTRFVDIKPSMRGHLEKLKDPNFFKRVVVDKELGTITWPGEIDLDPDNLYIQGIDSKDIEELYKVQQEPNDWLESV